MDVRVESNNSHMTGLTARPSARTIKIYISPDCGPISARVGISAGTCDAGEAKVAEFEYERGAKIPRRPWRQLNQEEYTQFVTAEPSDDIGRSISVVKLPIAFTDEARTAIARYCHQPMAPYILELLRTICVLDEPIAWLGRHRNPPNLCTVTVNEPLRKYIGLHVDNWDGFALAERDSAPNRICVNIGESNRYFLCLPFPLTEIARRLADEGVPWSPNERLTVIARRFMDRFPDAPVVRCCVAPGEAYIAPTENLVHDGSSEGQSKQDDLFTVRGRVRLL